MALTTRQKMFAGMKPVCAVRSAMTHMTKLLIAQSAQPSQHRRPSKMVDAIVKTHET
jgi:hypothetical protein